MERGHRLCGEVTGLTDQRKDAIGDAGPAKATVYTVGLLLAAMEDGTDRSTWRYPTDDARTYLTAIEKWGYTLADVERLVLEPATGGEDGDTDPGGDAEPGGDEAEPDAEAPVTDPDDGEPVETGSGE